MKVGEGRISTSDAGFKLRETLVHGSHIRLIVPKTTSLVCKLTHNMATLNYPTKTGTLLFISIHVEWCFVPSLDNAINGII